MTAGSAERGFTLLELIVAAGILALIAVFSWRGLDTLIREREAIAASQSTIDVMQRSFARVERDAMLASDVALDGSGTMRLVAGSGSSIEGAGAATVEYRLVSGAWTRTVVGVDRSSLVMIDGVASLTMEAWSPGPRGGGTWVRAKDVASEPGPPAAAPAAGTSPSSPSTNNPAPSPPPTDAQAAQPTRAAPPTAIPAATGVRISLALADGTRIVRSFLVGGA